MKQKFARIRHATTMYKRVGFSSFFSAVVLNGITKRIKSRVGYICNRSNYKQKCLFVAGLPKSGSTWVSDLLRSLPGFSQFTPVHWNQNYQVGEIGAAEHALYPGWQDEFRGMLAVVKGHTWGTPENVAVLRESGSRYVLTVRDPRDVIISEYWFVRRTPHHASYSMANSLSLGEYITARLDGGAFEAMTLDWIRSWLANRDPDSSIILRYEDLLLDPFSCLKRTVAFLKLDVPADVIRQSVELNSFERKAARKQGTEDTSKFLRKGTSGQWRDVFTAAHLESFARAGEDVITALGYPPTFPA
jgi:hypothetical protein